MEEGKAKKKDLSTSGKKEEAYRPYPNKSQGRKAILVLKEPQLAYLFLPYPSLPKGRQEDRIDVSINVRIVRVKLQV